MLLEILLYTLLDWLLDWRFWWTLILLGLVGLIVFGAGAVAYGVIQRWRRRPNHGRSRR